MTYHASSSLFVEIEKPTPAHLYFPSRGSIAWIEDRSRQSSLDSLEKAELGDAAKRSGQWHWPERLPSSWREWACVACICMSHVLVEYFNLGFTLMLSSILKKMGQQSNHSIWPISAYPIAIGALTLPCGRVQDKIGSHPCLVFGLIWLALASLVTGYANSFWMLCVCRAVSGIGPAIFLASGVKLLERLYPSGRRKHLANYLYAISSSFGVFSGLFAAGLVSAADLNTGWYYWIGASLSLATALLAFLMFPKRVRMPLREKQPLGWNWTGSLFSAVGLGLVLTSITHGAYGRHQWTGPLIYPLLVVGVLCLGLAIYIERRIADTPLLPRYIFDPPRMNCLLAVVFIDSGLVGLCLAFGARLLQQTNQVSLLRLVLWYLPVYLIGPLISLFDFWVRNGPRTRVLIWAQYCWVVATTLIAVSTANASYWVFAFTSMVFASVASFSTYDTASMFVYHSLTPKDEGLTSTLVNLLKHVGMAFFLGIGDNFRNTIELRGTNSSDSIKSVFWFGLAAAIISLVITMLWVRIDDEDEKHVIT